MRPIIAGDARGFVPAGLSGTFAGPQRNTGCGRRTGREMGKTLNDPAGDDELLARIAVGDATAFTTLFRRRHGEVFRFALHMIGSPAAAEDVTQDAFLTLMREAERYQPGRSSGMAWLCGIARNHALRRLERERSVVPLDEDATNEARALAVNPDPLGDLT